MQASGHVRSFSVSDISSNISLGLDVLNGYGKLTSITVSDAQSLAISFAQFGNDAVALGKISGTCRPLSVA